LPGKYILAHDVGTEVNKAALFDIQGKIVSLDSEVYGVNYPQPCWAEQDPEVWWRAVVKSTRRLIGKSGVSPAEVIALSFDAMMMTALPVDREGRALRPAIIWLDARAGEQAAWCLESLDLFKLLDMGIIPPVSEKDVIPKLLWIKEKEPEVFERTYKFMDVKDYIVYKCTGEFCTDWSCALLTGLFSSKTKRWERELIQTVGLSGDMLSTAVESTDVVGSLTASAAEELGLSRQTKVVCGSGDAPAVAIGSGATGEGQAHLYTGSSGWIATHVTEPRFDVTLGIGSICSAIPDKLLLIGQMENAGACLKWFRDALGGEEKAEAQRRHMRAYQVLDELAREVEPGAGKLIFMPWMLGERCPVINPALRGAFINLGFNHSKGHLVRAILEGVAYNTRWVLEGIEGLGFKVESLNAAGGGALSEVWLQIYADVLGKRIRQVQSPQEAGSRGAALMALVGLGIYNDFDSVAELVPLGRELEPGDEHRAIYDELYGCFKQLYEQLVLVYGRLNPST